MVAGDDIVDITFNNDQITGSAGTINVSGTITVDYTTSTASGSLRTTGATNQTYTPLTFTADGVGDYRVEVFFPRTAIWARLIIQTKLRPVSFLL